jgi:asparagine synthase (glutamine-hydrolysing)
VSQAPKRPVQTPQREWLRGPLREWTCERVRHALELHPDWLNARLVTSELRSFLAGGVDNSFFVWQWISLSLAAASRPPVTPVMEPLGPGRIG